MIGRQKEETQIIIVKKDIRTDSTGLKWIRRDHYEQQKTKQLRN